MSCNGCGCKGANQLHPRIDKRLQLYWALARRYEEVGLPFPAGLMMAAANEQLSKRKWESMVAEARQRSAKGIICFAPPMEPGMSSDKS